LGRGFWLLARCLRWRVLRRCIKYNEPGSAHPAKPPRLPRKERGAGASKTDQRAKSSSFASSALEVFAPGDCQCSSLPLLRNHPRSKNSCERGFSPTREVFAPGEYRRSSLPRFAFIPAHEPNTSRDASPTRESFASEDRRCSSLGEQARGQAGGGREGTAGTG
jgi:hypothetical protein